ncbi:Cas10/Cmr2 second palm domain-containing protein [Thiorhodovibrio frisius]|uniref:Cas10/Cmr2 second palm domain-containing protein n=1 Tax=Thiorhodovibrio frisius TaxID=631362 RepID=H8YVT7_9GAMM|nr:hypothetical protein [Thiorhodovibrio frisius]EIC24027.1 hypothetical protein Thi970DRAFT_00168 [Thiorhodovibrio frisius]WPL23101.1 CRISPR-associated protein Cas10/Cmr2, subtype III-B [Thiorhodovibrio frisius]
MTYYVYAFEAKDIQEYILERTRLAEMMGASGLIDAICSAMLDAALSALALADKRDFHTARRGGGGFTLVFQKAEPAHALRDLISLIMPQFAPDLPFVHAIGDDRDERLAIEAALRQLPIAQQQPVLPLPLATPPLHRAPRTGLPAWGHFPKVDGEAIDRAALAKRRFTQDRLGKKFSLGDDSTVWPRNLNPNDLNPNDPGASAENLFPFHNANHRVAIVHIDGNGFGQALQDIRTATNNSSGEQAITVEFAFSQLVEAMSCEAAQEATMEVLLDQAVATEQETSIMPARPLVLGGDDLTMILRADLALDFVEHYMRAFERISAAKIKEFAKHHQGIKPKTHCMTTCAGVVFVGAKRPFDRAYRLAEALCAEAKQCSARHAPAGGPAPSFLAFGDSTASLSCDDDVLVTSSAGTRLAGTAYHLGVISAPDAPEFDALKALKTLYVDRQAELARSALNDVIVQLRHDETEAERRWKRWLAVIARRGETGAALRQQWQAHLARVAPSHRADPTRTPVLERVDERTQQRTGAFSPLGDLLAWLKAEARFNDSDT